MLQQNIFLSRTNAGVTFIPFQVSSPQQICLINLEQTILTTIKTVPKAHFFVCQRHPLERRRRWLAEGFGSEVNSRVQQSPSISRPCTARVCLLPSYHIKIVAFLTFVTELLLRPLIEPLYRLGTVGTEIGRLTPFAIFHVIYISM